MKENCNHIKVIELELLAVQVIHLKTLNELGKVLINL